MQHESIAGSVRQETKLSITLHDLNEIGPFISGISFAVTAVTSVITLTIINSRQMTNEWLERFRILYGKFWDDSIIAEVREWISNDKSYNSEIKELLNTRNSRLECDIDSNDYIKLEKIDRFCSLLVRVRSFGVEIKMTPSQKELWGKLLYEFWIGRMRNRPELMQYVSIHWQQLQDDVDVKLLSNPFFEIFKLLGKQAEEKKTLFLNFPRRP